MRNPLPILFVLLAFVSSLTAEEVSRPHVVMCFADDWGQYASAYGKLTPGGPNDVVKTPNFDAIAGEGVLFTNGFVSAPSCTPCRSSLLSGQHFWRCERASILLGAIWDGSIPSYPLMLEDEGYRIGHTYKVWSPGKPADAPHGGKRTAHDSAGRKFNGFSQNAMKNPDREAGKAALLNEVRMNVRSFLDADDDGQLDGDDPICYWFGPTNTHRKWIAGSGKELWGIEPDDLKGKMPAYLPDVPVVREDFADYLGEAMAFDASLAVIREELQRVGIEDDTLMVVSGDHGIPGVTRGKCNLYDLGTQVPLAIRWPKGIPTAGRVVTDFVSLPDLAVTFLDAAGVDAADNMTAKSLMNILQSEKSGRVDPLRDAVFTGRERHVDSARANYLPYPQRAIRTDSHLFIINFEPDRTPMGDGYAVAGSGQELPQYADLRESTFAAYADLDASPTKAFVITNKDEYPEEFEYAVGLRPRFELYDVIADPDCLNNLAEDSASAGIRKKLEDRLMGELHATGDPRVSDDVIFERSPYSDPATKRKVVR